MQRSIVVAVMLALCCFVPSCVLADSVDAPITLDKCYMDLTHDDDDNLTLRVGVAVTNTSPNAVVAIKVRFYQLDAFKTVLGLSDDEVFMQTLRAGKSIAPQTSLFGHHLFFGSEFPESPAWDVYAWKNVAYVMCKVLAVKFADGTGWAP